MNTSVSTPPRELLYINPDQACRAAFPQLRAAGWVPRPVDDWQRARRVVESTEYEVGIVRIDPRASLGEVLEFTAMLQRRHTEWIALLAKDALAVPSLRQIVAEHFFDFHTQPLDLCRMLTTLGHALGMARIKKLDRLPADRSATEEEMVGCSAPMTALFRSIRKVAGTDAPVLIRGESGTGKELAARAIHERSARADRPFVAINCGAIPGTLIQSELFGYEKGAFTGAAQRKIGRIESAAGGTLFLDEIGDLSLELQANLLRFLQERQIDRVGGTAPVAVDLRVIAATHIDLDKAVAEGSFREDLYHRLNVLFLRVPSLRERDGDIELLARYFFEHFASERRRSLRGFSRAALAAMSAHEWTGNVRELINRVRRALVMCEGRFIQPEDLGFQRPHTLEPITTLEEARAHAEREAIRAALGRHARNLARSARELGVSRVTLYRLIEKHGLRMTGAGA